MLYLSQLLGTIVEDQQHTRLGKLIDVLVPANLVGSSAAVYPSALLVENEAGKTRRVSPQFVERSSHALRLLIPVSQLPLTPSHNPEHEIELVHDVQDKHVIYVERKKAVRVSDVCFEDDWRVLGIDASPLGLIRRLVPAWIKARPRVLIPWDQIEPIEAQEPEDSKQELAEALPVRSSSGHLAEMHPADIAEIVHQLSAGEGARLIERLDDETAAATMEEIDTERQRQILESIESERAADILQTMGPDEAADLLANMPEERAEELLHLMTPEESEEVKELLVYEANTAGGLMTTDYTVLNQQRTVSEALGAVRSDILKYDVRLPYVYCVEDELQETQKLLGVVSLWDLIAADTRQPLSELMETDLISVQAQAQPREVVELMAKYNLLALPVIDEDGMLHGVITIDDALDVLLPPDRRRQPRMY